MLRRTIMALAATLVFEVGSTTAVAQSNLSRFELGGHVTTMGRFDATIPAPAELALEPGEFSHGFNPGGGFRFTLNITTAIALETEANFLPTEIEYTGRSRQWFYGLKIGGRKKGLGVFAKARLGYMYFTKSYCDEFGFFKGFYTCLGSYKKNPALDVGAVVEFYPAKRTIVRLDFGDTIVHFGNINRYQPELGAANRAIHVAGGTTHSFQTNIGIGIRF